MIVNKVNLEAVAVEKKGYPINGLPEIAFCGRSNVGKSSLINTMINRKALARTSQNPGKTRTINFYNVEDKLYFVDLPGYGYAKASKSESQKWGKMIETYLLERPQLKAIALLLDIRHEPSENDKIMFNFINHYNYDVIVAATKTDKISRNKLPSHIAMLKKSLGLDKEVLIPFSSFTRQGKDEFWKIIEEKILF